MSEKSILDKISEERKQGIEDGTIPPWYVTPGYQLFKSKYQIGDATVKDTYKRIASAAAKHLPPEMRLEYQEKFFQYMWNGWLCPATPVMANMGAGRGCPVSCQGTYVPDSIYGFYDSTLETAILTKNGFGTSSYLGDIRGRGKDFAGGGKTSGVIPVIRQHVQVARDVSQGSTRRGAWAGYLPIDHDDFYEVIEYLKENPDDLNLGWIVSDDFINRLKSKDRDAKLRFQKAMKVKCLTGKGYFFFVDKVNRDAALAFKTQGLKIHASNLCTEIMQPSNEEYSFTCVLSSLNLFKYDEWKDTDLVQVSTVFLDCIVSEFIDLKWNEKGFEKVVEYTIKSRSIGLGVLGFHSYIQKQGWPFESFNSYQFNSKVFKQIDTQSLEASMMLAKKLGEPEWCKGLGVRNAVRMAVAPTSSNALLSGGVSQGIEPVVENVYNQTGPAGEIARVNPVLLDIMKERGIFNKKTLSAIIDDNGSVQNVDWLSAEEKEVFKTAFEIRQEAIINMAASRQMFIDQGQSLNLFFDADEDERYIAFIHQLAFLNEGIKALYYLRSKSGVHAAKTNECVACEG